MFAAQTKYVLATDETEKTTDKTLAKLDADGNPVIAEGGGAAIYLDTDVELVNYPAVQTKCSACHKDDAKLFADDGGLTSGKRAIAVSTNQWNPTSTKYVSPVAESCRSCHAHSGAAALAHFESNGAILLKDNMGVADLPLSVESCATCHAEGKTYGIDKMHMGGAH
jgi:OmcA/MtrC family decaheme c-type cytochrome